MTGQASGNYGNGRIQPGEFLDPAICAQLLTGAILNLNTNRYILAAGLTIALYEIFLLFSDEVRLVWNSGSKMSMRLLYFFNHYIPPALLIVANYQLSPFRHGLNNDFCRMWISCALIFQVMCGMCSSYVLLLRVIALFGDNLTVKRLIYGAFIASYSISITSIAICVVSIHRRMGYYLDLNGVCSYSDSEIWFIIAMTSPILSEVIAGGLTIWKAFHHAYALWSSSSAPLLHSLLRDGIFFCVSIVCLRVCYAFIWFMLPKGSAYLALYILWAPMSIMSSRFYINIKSVATVDPFSPEYSLSLSPRKRITTGGTTFARVSRRTTTMTMGSLSHFSRTDIFSASDGTAWREPEVFDAHSIEER